MNRIYLDNAATTSVDTQVIDVVCTSMLENNGNPSSTHQFGRTAKASVETARKNIAKHLNVTASELVFTAGGTEADNLILHNAVVHLGAKTVITSLVEHHAVLHPLAHLKKTHNITIEYVAVDDRGVVDLIDLERLLSQTSQQTLVSLMQVNNEVGNLLPMAAVAALCKQYKALFHSDTVQAVGHFPVDLQAIPVDFITASAHKFHGPKGVGFAYFKKGFGVQPLFYGGAQENGARSSTENVHAIVGMEKALDIAIENLEKDTEAIGALKKYFIEQLEAKFLGVAFNGLSAALEKSSYTILSVRFPVVDDMLLFRLDMAGIAVSGGSACQSGSNKGSHVLQAFLSEADAVHTSVRFSFSKYTTKEELDVVLGKLQELL